MKNYRMFLLAFFVITLLIIATVQALDAPASTMIGIRNPFWNTFQDYGYHISAEQTTYDVNAGLVVSQTEVIPDLSMTIFDPFAENPIVEGDNPNHHAVTGISYNGFMPTQSLGLGRTGGAICLNGQNNAAGTIYLPYVANNGDGVTTISVLNTGDAADPFFTFYNDGGSVEAHGQTGGDIPSDHCYRYPVPISNWSGSAIITCTSQIVVVAEISNNDSSMAYPGIPDTHTTVYLPQLFNDHNGWNSDIMIQNTSDQAAEVSVSFYDQNGNNISNCGCGNLPSGASWVLEPPSGVTGAEVESNSSIAAVVNNYGDADQMWSYRGRESHYKPDIPLVFKNSSGWNSSFTVRNVSPDGNNLMRWTYYGQDGSQIGPTEDVSIPPFGALVVDIATDNIISNTATFMGSVHINTNREASTVVSHNNNGQWAGATLGSVDFGKKEEEDLPEEPEVTYYFPSIYKFAVEFIAAPGGDDGSKNSIKKHDDWPPCFVGILTD